MIALISGAGRGIGREISLALARKGFHTILAARTESEINSVAREIIASGAAATAFTCDITDSKSVTSLYDETKTVGRIDLLVNNAGIAPSAKIEETDDEIWEDTFAVNVDGAFFLIRAFLQDMKAVKNGHIINIASTAAVEGFAYTAAYTASKHALLGLSRAIAREISRFNIKVSTLCPGFVRTGILESGISTITTRTGKSREEAEAQLAVMNRSGKIIEPREIADAVVAELEAPFDPNGREIIL